MVAPASTLSDKDRALLTVYIAVRFNLMELASQTSGDLLTLQDWALEPAIQAQVARYRQLETLQHETEAADAKSAGIATLLDLLTTTQDPIERRRAAQTLIRVGSPDPARPESSSRPGQQPRPERPHDDRPDRDAHLSESRDDSTEDELQDHLEDHLEDQLEDVEESDLEESDHDDPALEDPDTVQPTAGAPESPAPRPALIPIGHEQVGAVQPIDPARSNGRHITSGP